MKTVRVVFLAGPEDGLERRLPEPLPEHYFFPRSAVVVVPGLPSAVLAGRYIYLLDLEPDDPGRQVYRYEGEC